MPSTDTSLNAAGQQLKEHPAVLGQHPCTSANTHPTTVKLEGPSPQHAPYGACIQVSMAPGATSSVHTKLDPHGPVHIRSQLQECGEASNHQTTA